jgi:hypothetical protein
MSAGEVRHKKGLATVVANDPRSLAQAVSAVREEYGWVVDFEDPPYTSDADLVDITNPQWRATHPGGRVVKVPAGGAFQCDFAEGVDMNNHASRMGVLRKLVAEYNRSPNPGKFEVRDDGDGRYTIVGVAAKNHARQDESVSPILDTIISIPVQQRSAFETLELIAKTLSSKTGTQVSLVQAPISLLRQSQVTVGGENLSARALVTQTLDATKRPLVWDLLYESNFPLYGFNIGVARQNQVDTFGRKRAVPIDALQRRD